MINHSQSWLVYGISMPLATSALEAAYAKLPPLEDVPLEDIVHVSERLSLGCLQTPRNAV